MSDDGNRGGQPINWIAIVGAIASLGGAGISYLAQTRAGEANARAQEALRIQQADHQKQQNALQQLVADRSYQLSVAERVAKAVESGSASSSQMNVACALVVTLPDTADRLRRQLAVLLVEEARRVSTTAGATGYVCSDLDALRDTIAETPSVEQPFETPVANAAPEPTTDDKFAAEAPAPPAAPTRPGVRALEDTMLVQSPDPRGWDIDVFYCDATGRTRAQTAASALAEAATARRQIAPGLSIGRVRLRALSPQTNARSGYRIAQDEIRAEASEAADAAHLASFVASKSAPVVLHPSTMRTPWYISMFYCGPS